MTVIFLNQEMDVIEVFDEYLLIQDCITGLIYTIGYWQIENNIQEELFKPESNIISLEEYKKCQKRKNISLPKKTKKLF